MKHTAPIFRDIDAVFQEYLGQLSCRQIVAFRSTQLLVETVINSFTEQNIASLCRQSVFIYLFMYFYSLYLLSLSQFLPSAKKREKLGKGRLIYFVCYFEVVTDVQRTSFVQCEQEKNSTLTSEAEY